MSLNEIKSNLPDYAKDIKLNISSIANETALTPQQLHGTLLASSLATKNAKLIAAVMTDAQAVLTPDAITAAKAAASIMAMNNIYYRFVHLASNKSYQAMPAKLRMTVIGKPGVEKADFELWSLAVSAINGCGMCIDAHEVELQKAGLGADAIQAAVRIASIIHATACTLDGEAALSQMVAQAA